MNVTCLLWAEGVLLCRRGKEKRKGCDLSFSPSRCSPAWQPKVRDRYTRFFFFFFCSLALLASRRDYRDGSPCDASCIVSVRPAPFRSWAAVRASGKHRGSPFFLACAGFDCLNLYQPCNSVNNTNQTWLTPDGTWCYSLGIGVSVRLVCQGMCDTFGVMTCADNTCTTGCVVNEEFKQALGLQIWDGKLHLNNGQGQVSDLLVPPSPPLCLPPPPSLASVSTASRLATSCPAFTDPCRLRVRLARAFLPCPRFSPICRSQRR